MIHNPHNPWLFIVWPPLGLCVPLLTPGGFNDARPDVSTFQGLILALQQYWAEQGCVILQPLDMEVGAGTFHPATFCAP